jgi:hypothetical protein
MSGPGFPAPLIGPAWNVFTMDVFIAPMNVISARLSRKSNGLMCSKAVHKILNENMQESLFCF